MVTAAVDTSMQVGAALLAVTAVAGGLLAVWTDRRARRRRP